MMTLEQAINRLEDMVSGNYQIQFPNSELRLNTKDSAELIKFNLMSILGLIGVWTLAQILRKKYRRAERVDLVGDSLT